MSYAVSQGVSLTLGGTAVANVTQVQISENAPTIETSDLSLAANSYRTFIPGLKDAADVTINHIGEALSIGSAGAFVCGALTFAGSTVMSSEVAYRVGEIVAYTSTLRASN